MSALAETLPRINGLKNVLVMIANGVAGIVFVIISEVDWWIVRALAVGSVLGAQVGARVGRKLPPIVYRVVIVTASASPRSSPSHQLVRRLQAGQPARAPPHRADRPPPHRR